VTHLDFPGHGAPGAPASRTGSLGAASSTASLDPGPIDKRLAGRPRGYLMEHRAHSQAPPGAYTRDDMADDVIGVMDQLGIERSIMAGHLAIRMAKFSAAGLFSSARSHLTEEIRRGKNACK
jgi:pimeloyl-ACP methyl ester carboxylesterase